MKRQHHKKNSRPPPVDSRRLRERENNSREPREGFANEKTSAGSLAKASRKGKLTLGASRRLRENKNKQKQQ